MRPSFSIVRRLSLVVAGFGLLAALLNLLLTAKLFGPLLDDYALSQARQGALVQRLLHTTAEPERPALLAELARLGYQVGTAEPSGLGAEDPLYPPHVLHGMQWLLGPDQPLEFAAMPGSGRGPAMSTQVRLPDGRAWWVTLTAALPTTAPMTTAILAMLGVGAVVAGVAVLSVRLFTRPMAELAQQLLARRDALRPLQAPQHASEELHQLTDAFNQLARALKDQEQQRQQLMAGLSHDLRTPLARVRLRAECLLPAEALPPMEADFEVLDRIIGQFVTYTQVGLTPHPVGRPLALHALQARTAARYAHRAGLRFEPLPPGLADWRFPDLALMRLLINLIDNALEHGRAPVQVLARPGPPMGLPASPVPSVELWVRDSGPGIGPLASRLRPKTTAQPEGRVGGLGLRIAAQLARQLGGELLGQPHDGHGAAVGVRLPRPETDVVRSALAAASASPLAG